MPKAIDPASAEAQLFCIFRYMLGKRSCCRNEKHKEHEGPERHGFACVSGADFPRSSRLFALFRLSLSPRKQPFLLWAHTDGKQNRWNPHCHNKGTQNKIRFPPTCARNQISGQRLKNRTKKAHRRHHDPRGQAHILFEPIANEHRPCNLRGQSKFALL